MGRAKPTSSGSAVKPFPSLPSGQRMRGSNKIAVFRRSKKNLPPHLDWIAGRRRDWLKIRARKNSQGKLALRAADANDIVQLRSRKLPALTFNAFWREQA